MVDKFGSDQQQLANSGGSVISQDNAVLINGDSDGEDALLFGPAALREIQSNVANGDFAIAPSNAEGVISDDNALPYWTGVQTGTAPTVSAAITASAVTASQSALTFTVAAGAATNSAYTFTRYVPIAGNANRSSAYHPEVYSVTTTGGAGDKARVRITLTATAVDADYAALTVTATANETASTLTSKSLFTNWIVPDAKAAYILVSVKVDVPATAPVGAVTVVIGEVRVARSEGSIAFPALQNPSGQPWIIENDNLIFEVYPQTEVNPKITMESNASTSSFSINLLATGANGEVNIQADGVASVAGGLVTIDSDTTVEVSGRLDTNSGIANTGTITSTSHITGGRFYPSNQATRYIEDNGTYLRAINDFWAVGSLFQTTSGIRVPVIRVGEGAAATTSIPASGSLTVTVTFPALPTTPNFAVVSIHWIGVDANATVVVSTFASTSSITVRLYNQTTGAITSSRAINYVVGAEN
jgi:hypothetical protein